MHPDKKLAVLGALFVFGAATCILVSFPFVYVYDKIAELPGNIKYRKTMKNIREQEDKLEGEENKRR